MLFTAHRQASALRLALRQLENGNRPGRQRDRTVSGNLHGTPVAYYTGQPGFAGYFPELGHPVPTENVCMIGIRSVDPAEQAAIRY